MKKLTYKNSAISQRARILKKFKRKPQLDTFELRKMGIMHPSGRVHEMRRLMHNILTVYVKKKDDNGVLHRIAKYCYIGMKKEAANEER